MAVPFAGIPFVTALNWGMRALGLAITTVATITEFGQQVLVQVHAYWSAIFDIALPGSTSTIGDWMVISGLAYFMTVVMAAYLIKLIIKGTKAAFSIIPVV